MSSTVSCRSAAQSVAVSSRMPAQILATPIGWTMKSSPLARRWSACRSQANTNAFWTSSRSTFSAASSACSSTTAKRSPSRTRWSSVSLVGGPAGACPACASTGWRSKSRSLPRPFAARLERLGARFLAGVLAMRSDSRAGCVRVGRAYWRCRGRPASRGRAAAPRGRRALGAQPRLDPPRSARGRRGRSGESSRSVRTPSTTRHAGGSSVELDQPELAEHREQRARRAPAVRGWRACAAQRRLDRLRAAPSSELAQSAEAARSGPGAARARGARPRARSPRRPGPRRGGRERRA